MIESEFFRPESLEQALQLLEQYGESAMVVNGGTDAVLSLVEKKVSPRAIIHIARLPKFQEITQDNGVIRIGGGVTYSQMLASTTLRAYRGLTEAVIKLASPAIRAIATPAGNICTAAPSADCTTILLALRAKVHLLSISSERTVALEEFFTGTYQTVKRPNEVVTYLEIPSLRKDEGTGYWRLSRRKAQDIGKVLVGTRVRVEKGILTDVSISLGALNAYAVRATGLEQALTNKPVAQALAYAANHFPDEASLRESYFKAYKLDVTCTAIERALSMAVADAEGGSV